jgi:hypothetical protein
MSIGNAWLERSSQDSGNNETRKVEVNLRSKVMACIGAVISVAGISTGMGINAHAADAGAVVFRAPTTGLTPIPPIGQGVNQPGTYSFSSLGGLCAGVEVESEVGVNGTACVITSNGGHYVNLACGTGTATDTTATVAFGADVESTPYQIVFVAGVGVILPVGTTNVVAGVVQITPTNFPTENCVTAGVSSFTATGVAVAVTAGT